MGDLPGITSRLDYLKDLGVDAIWLTPFYPSPQKDHGYDIADYFDVNPEYGSLGDFQQLVERAHELGLKVLVDLVPNHTSDRHPWFQAALSAPDHPYRSRYYFRDSKPDGSPPNNWVSAFGGSAWTRDERSGQWYLHLFAPEQPDLDWRDPAVPAEFERILRFWSNQGADGYRIDVASALFKREDLADRPTIVDPISGAFKPDPVFAIIDQPPVHEVYRRWRAILNGYRPARVLVGEIFEPHRQRRYVLPDQLDMAFALIRSRWDASLWRRAIDVDRWALRGPGQAPSWTLSNHDVIRHVTRLGGGFAGRARARAAFVLLSGLPGQVFLYQGEELGLEEVEVPPKRRQDPIYMHNGGMQNGRDGCRVPLPWRKGLPNAGFSTVPPWLPLPVGWDGYAVDAQSGAASSMLTFYKRVLALRRTLAGVLPSEISWCGAPEGVLAYRRGRLTVAVNFLARPMEACAVGRVLVATDPLVRSRAGRVQLPPNSAAWMDALGVR